MSVGGAAIWATLGGLALVLGGLAWVFAGPADSANRRR